MSLSVVHTHGRSPSQAEGLPGKPAFSSVLTVMAGTVKHPGSADQSGASPTVSMDGTHTTQRPSRSSSRDSEMSSSALSAGARTLPSSGLILSCYQVFPNPHVPFLSGALHILSLSSSLPSAVSLIIRPSPAEQINNARSPFYKSMITSNLFPSEAPRLSAAEFVERKNIPPRIKRNQAKTCSSCSTPTLTQSLPCPPIMKLTNSLLLSQNCDASCCSPAGNFTKL